MAKNKLEHSNKKCGKGHFPNQCTCGRPPKINKDVLAKLEEAFLIGCTDEEACFYSSISVDALYNYQKKHPEFIVRKEQMKQKPFLKARKTIVENLHVPEHAKWYMERKKKVEFAARKEITDADGAPLKIVFDSAFNEKE